MQLKKSHCTLLIFILIISTINCDDHQTTHLIVKRKARINVPAPGWWTEWWAKYIGTASDPTVRPLVPASNNLEYDVQRPENVETDLNELHRNPLIASTQPARLSSSLAGNKTQHGSKSTVKSGHTGRPQPRHSQPTNKHVTSSPQKSETLVSHSNAEKTTTLSKQPVSASTMPSSFKPENTFKPGFEMEIQHPSHVINDVDYESHTNHKPAPFTSRSLTSSTTRAPMFSRKQLTNTSGSKTPIRTSKSTEQKSRLHIIPLTISNASVPTSDTRATHPVSKPPNHVDLAKNQKKAIFPEKKSLVTSTLAPAGIKTSQQKPQSHSAIVASISRTRSPSLSETLEPTEISVHFDEDIQDLSENFNQKPAVKSALKSKFPVSHASPATSKSSKSNISPRPSIQPIDEEELEELKEPKMDISHIDLSTFQPSPKPAAAHFTAVSPRSAFTQIGNKFQKVTTTGLVITSTVQTKTASNISNIKPTIHSMTDEADYDEETFETPKDVSHKSLDSPSSAATKRPRPVSVRAIASTTPTNFVEKTTTKKLPSLSRTGVKTVKSSPPTFAKTTPKKSTVTKILETSEKSLEETTPQPLTQTFGTREPLASKSASTTSAPILPDVHAIDEEPLRLPKGSRSGVKGGASPGVSGRPSAKTPPAQSLFRRPVVSKSLTTTTLRPRPKPLSVQPKASEDQKKDYDDSLKKKPEVKSVTKLPTPTTVVHHKPLPSRPLPDTLSPTSSTSSTSPASPAKLGVKIPSSKSTHPSTMHLFVSPAKSKPTSTPHWQTSTSVPSMKPQTPKHFPGTLKSKVPTVKTTKIPHIAPVSRTRPDESQETDKPSTQLSFSKTTTAPITTSEQEYDLEPIRLQPFPVIKPAQPDSVSVRPKEASTGLSETEYYDEDLSEEKSLSPQLTPVKTSVQPGVKTLSTVSNLNISTAKPQPVKQIGTTIKAPVTSRPSIKLVSTHGKTKQPSFVSITTPTKLDFQPVSVSDIKSEPMTSLTPDQPEEFFSRMPTTSPVKPSTTPKTTYTRPVIYPRPGVKAPSPSSRAGVKSPKRKPIMSTFRPPARPFTTSSVFTSQSPKPSTIETSSPKAEEIHKSTLHETTKVTVKPEHETLSTSKILEAQTSIPAHSLPSSIASSIKTTSSPSLDISAKNEYDVPKKPVISTTKQMAKLPPAQTVTRRPSPAAFKPVSTTVRPQPRPIPAFKSAEMTFVGPDHFEELKETISKAPITSPVQPATTPAKPATHSTRPIIYPRPGVKTPPSLSRSGVKSPSALPKRPVSTLSAKSTTLQPKPTATPSLTSIKPQFLTETSTNAPIDKEYEDNLVKKPVDAPSRLGVKSPPAQMFSKGPAVKSAKQQPRPVTASSRASTIKPSPKPSQVSPTPIPTEEKLEDNLIKKPITASERAGIKSKAPAKPTISTTSLPQHKTTTSYMDEYDYEATRKPVAVSSKFEPTTQSFLTSQQTFSPTKKPTTLSEESEEYDDDNDVTKKPSIAPVRPVSPRIKVKVPPAKSLPRIPTATKSVVSTTLRPLPRPAQVPVPVPAPVAKLQPTIEDNEDYEDTLPKQPLTAPVKSVVQPSHGIKSPRIKSAPKSTTPKPPQASVYRKQTTLKPDMEEYDYHEEMVTSKSISSLEPTTFKPSSPKISNIVPLEPNGKTTLTPRQSSTGFSQKTTKSFSESDFDDRKLFNTTTTDVMTSITPKVSTSSLTSLDQVKTLKESSIEPIISTKSKPTLPEMTYTYLHEPAFGQRLSPPRSYINNFIGVKKPSPRIVSSKPQTQHLPLPRKPSLAEFNEIDETKKEQSSDLLRRPTPLEPASNKNGPLFSRMVQFSTTKIPRTTFKPLSVSLEFQPTDEPLKEEDQDEDQDISDVTSKKSLFRQTTTQQPSDVTFEIKTTFGSTVKPKTTETLKSTQKTFPTTVEPTKKPFHFTSTFRAPFQTISISKPVTRSGSKSHKEFGHTIYEPPLGPPTKIARPDQPLADGSMPNCTLLGSNYCIITKDYPMEGIKEVVSRSFNRIKLMYEELQTVGDPALFKNYHGDTSAAAQGQFACETESSYMKPGWARDEITKEWMVVVNTDLFPQQVRTESCKKPNEPCSFVAPYYESTCQQRYSLHRLIAIDPHDPSKSPVVALFKFPAGCSCRVNPIRLTQK